MQLPLVRDRTNVVPDHSACLRPAILLGFVMVFLGSPIERLRETGRGFIRGKCFVAGLILALRES